eukprot:SAG22_NODE_451_length_10354_cov_5.184983_11_plen_161_part_00
MWHRGMPNKTAMPRHMIGVGYCAERDPGAECSHLGLGKHRHLFSDTVRPAFARPQPPPGTADGAASRQLQPVLVDRNISFVPGRCDHFGNPDPDAGDGDGSGDGELIVTGPYAGAQKGENGRFTYWLPDGPVPSNLVAVLPPGAVPEWVATLSAGGELER